MTTEMIQFIQENPHLKIKQCEHDKKFLVIENTTLNELSKLCAKYNASGSMCKGTTAQIGNFGKYK